MRTFLTVGGNIAIEADVHLYLVCFNRRFWAYFSQQSVATEYLQLTEDNNRGRKDYYLHPHDSDPTVPVTRADVYDRLVRVSISYCNFFD